jgi:hypothetical protein
MGRMSEKPRWEEGREGKKKKAVESQRAREREGRTDGGRDGGISI